MTGVTVGGRTAQFGFEDATPQLSDNPTVTQPQKLVVTPQPRRPGPRRGTSSPSRSATGAPRCRSPIPTSRPRGGSGPATRSDAPQTCDGSFVVNEPMGAQSWFPSNNYPTDKATFDTRITVPSSKTALGIGELDSRKTNRDGTTTWRWTEDDPTATYLTTATVGDFDLLGGHDDRDLDPPEAAGLQRHRQQRHAHAEGGDPGLARPSTRAGELPEQPVRSATRSTPPVPSPTAPPASATPSRCRPSRTTPAGSPTATRRSASVPSCTSSLTSGSATVSPLQAWSDIWFNEGWANWAEWWWQFRENGGDDPAAVFDDLYAKHPRRGLGDRPRRPGRRPRQHVRVLPDL